MQRPRSPLFLMALSGLWLALSSCGGGPTGPDPDPGPDLTAVAAVSVSGGGTVAIGATLQLTAAVTNVQGGALSNAVTWTSSATGVATVSGSGLVTGVAAGTATITASAGGRSGTASVTVNDPTPPAAPTGLSATAASQTEVDLTWTDGSSNESGFSIEREAVAGLSGGAGAGQAFAEIGTVGANVTTFRDTGLSASTAYRYRVRATNSNGASEYTNTAEVTTQASPVSITTTELPNGIVGKAYASTLVATGGTGNFTWAVGAGVLPAGLSLDAATGAISGTPTVVGTSNFQVSATSAGAMATQELSIIVVAAPPPAPGAFDIEFVYQSTVSTTVRDAFESARTRRQAVITGHLADVTETFGRVLAPGLHGHTGAMTFDEADLDKMATRRIGNPTARTDRKAR